MKTKTKKRKKSEGTRGPRKGSGGRPRKTEDRVGRSLKLCEVKEWPKLFRYSTGQSFTDRVRDVVKLAATSTKAERSKNATRWKAILTSKRSGYLDEAEERSIYLGAAEWAQLADLFPLGSWADRIRQALELARIVKAKRKAKSKTTK